MIHYDNHSSQNLADKKVRGSGMKSIRQGYKQTEIGEIPEEWEVARLGDVLLLARNGLTYGQNKDGNGYLITRIETISAGNIDKTKVGYLKTLSEKEIENYKLKAGDILFSHINSVEHIGKAAIYKGDPSLLIHGMNLLLLRPNKEEVLPPFLIQFLKWHMTRNRFRLMAKKAVNQASINQTEMKLFKIPLPPLPEQKKIAEILSTVDEAIQKTDEVIEKAQELKKGLMQQLLTKGIGHARFKQTELGEIPEEWEVVKADKICTRVTDGTHDTPKPSEDGYLLVTSKNIKDGKIDFSNCYFISEQDFIEVNKRSEVNVYDVLFSMIGTVGNAVLVTEKYLPFAIKNVGLFKTGENQDLGKWLFFYLSSNIIKKHINTRLKGTSQKFVPLGFLRKLPIILPLLSEQKKIAEILSTADEKIEIERKHKEKLEVLKKGLMQVLLTGKVRVRT